MSSSYTTVAASGISEGLTEHWKGEILLLRLLPLPLSLPLPLPGLLDPCPLESRGGAMKERSLVILLKSIYVCYMM